MDNKKRVKLTNIYSRNLLKKVRSPQTTFKRSKKVSLLNDDYISNPIYSLKKKKEKLKNISKIKYSVGQNQPYRPSNERGSLNFAMKNKGDYSKVQDPWNLKKYDHKRKKIVNHKNILKGELKKNTSFNLKSKYEEEGYKKQFLNENKNRVKVNKQKDPEIRSSISDVNYKSNDFRFISTKNPAENFQRKFLNENKKKEIRDSNNMNKSIDNKYKMKMNNSKEKFREKNLNENQKREKVLKKGKREIRGSIGANSYHSIDNRFGLVIKVRDNSKFKNVNLINKDFYNFKTLGEKTNPMFYGSADKRYKSCYADDNDVSVDKEYSLHDEANQFRENLSKFDKQQIVYKSEKPLLEKAKVNVKVKDFIGKTLKKVKKSPKLQEIKVNKNIIGDLEKNKNRNLNLNLRNTPPKFEEVNISQIRKFNNVPKLKKEEKNINFNTVNNVPQLQNIKVDKKLIGQIEQNDLIGKNNLHSHNEEFDREFALKKNIDLNLRNVPIKLQEQKMNQELHKEKDDHFEEIKSRAIFVKSSYDIPKVENVEISPMNFQSNNTRMVKNLKNSPQFEMQNNSNSQIKKNLQKLEETKNKNLSKVQQNQNLIKIQENKNLSKVQQNQNLIKLQENKNLSKVQKTQNPVKLQENKNLSKIQNQNSLKSQKSQQKQIIKKQKEENLLIETENGYFKGNITNEGLNGLGIIYNKEKKIIYEGGFLNNEFDGHGTIYNNLGSLNKIRVDFRDFNFIDNNWIKFDGMFCKSLKSGIGYLYFKNGDVFLGEFKDDKIHGFGVFRFDDEKILGIWENNVFVKNV